MATNDDVIRKLERLTVTAETTGEKIDDVKQAVVENRTKIESIHDTCNTIEKMNIETEGRVKNLEVVEERRRVNIRALWATVSTAVVGFVIHEILGKPRE